MRRSQRPSRRLSAAATTVAIAVGGCGGNREEAESTTTRTELQAPAPNLVTVERIEAQKKSAPERALLSWWRSVQFRDGDTAQSLTSQIGLQRAGGARELRDAVRAVGDALPGVVITDRVSTGENRANLRVFVVFYDSRGNEASREPMSFSLSRKDRAWKLDDVTYLRRLVPKKSNGD